MSSRFPLLLALAGAAVLFLSIAFVFSLVLGSLFFGGIAFTGEHADAIPSSGMFITTA